MRFDFARIKDSVFSVTIFASVFLSLLLIREFPWFPLFLVLLAAVLVVHSVIFKSTVYKISRKEDLALWLLGTGCSIALFLFLNDTLLHLLGAILISLVSAAFWSFLWRASLFPKEYGKHMVFFWRELAALYGFFMFSALFFALFIFFRFPAFLNAVFMGAAGAFLFWAAVFMGKETFSESGRQPAFFWAVFSVFLVVFELSWVLHFLPLGFFTSAFFLSYFFMCSVFFLASKTFGTVLTSKEKNIIIAGSALFLFMALFTKWI